MARLLPPSLEQWLSHGFAQQRLGRLAPSPMRDENLAVVGLTPARLGAFEPVGQSGAGACGTVDCCHERESQTRTWEAPPDGAWRPDYRGATRPELTTEHARSGPTHGAGPAFACSGPVLRPEGFTSQPRGIAAMSTAEWRWPLSALCLPPSVLQLAISGARGSARSGFAAGLDRMLVASPKRVPGARPSRCFHAIAAVPTRSRAPLLLVRGASRHKHHWGFARSG